MLGQVAITVATTVKNFSGKENGDVLDLCRDLREIFNQALITVGVDLERLDSGGLIAALYFLYGVGFLSAEDLTQISRYEPGVQTSHYCLNVVPSEDEKSLVRLEVGYIKETMLPRGR